MTENASAPEPVRTSIAPWLSVGDAPGAVDYYKAPFGAVERVSDGHGWRIGRLADPFGHHWEVGKPLTGPPGS